MIKFSYGSNNYKLKALANHLNIAQDSVVSFDLPAGYTCPAANICKTYATRTTGKIIDGKYSTVRCYAASMESRYSRTRKLHWNNLNGLIRLDENEITKLILEAIPNHTKIIRIHCSGDFFSQEYFNAWCNVATARPNIILFGYTKILQYATAILPDNFHLIYSHGGIYDDIADKLNIPQVYIVQPLDNPPAPIICSKGREYEDFYYILEQKSFSILIHGTQKAKRKE